MRKPSKYNVDQSEAGRERRTYKGDVYASQAECDYAIQCDTLGLNWERQVTFHLGDDKYVVDFVITEHDRTYAVDVKGKETASFLRHKGMWKRYGPMPLHIVRRLRNKRFTTAEIVERESK